MATHPVIQKLREQLTQLENAQRGSSRTIPIADEVDCWMPQGGLPTGCIHEVKGSSFAAALAFSSILSTRTAGNQGGIVYIASDRSLEPLTLYPLGLLPYGARLNQLLLVSVQRSQDLSWAVLEALRCSQVSAVMAVLENLDLTDSRRLQLAAENSGATGFLLGHVHSAPVAAPITRWRISSQPGKPGQRFDEPTWTLDLLYCRGGRPGSWTIEWRNQRMHTSLNPLVFHSPAAKQTTRIILAR